MRKILLACCSILGSTAAAMALGDGVPIDAERYIHGGVAGLSGFVVTNPGLPNNITVPGQYSFNLISTAFNSPLSGIGSPGATGCACVAGLQLTLTLGPQYSGIEAYGGSFGVVPTANSTTTSDFVGLSSGVDQEFTGNGNVYGGAAGVTVGAAGTSPFEVGHEVDVSLKAASGTPYRIGYNVVNIGNHQATTLDTAFSVECGVAGGCWQHLMTLTTFGGTLQPSLATTGDFFYSESTATVGAIFNLPNVTVTGNILNFPNVLLTGAGALTVKGDINITETNATLWLNFAASTDTAAINSTKNGTSRWVELLGNGTAEGGSNAGSDYQINGFNDAGSFLGAWFKMTRAAGAVTWGDATYASCTSLTTTAGLMGCTASDARLKNDFGNLDPNEAVAFAKNVNAKYFTFKDTANPFSDDRNHIGFFAQDIQQFAPNIAKFMVRTMAATSLTPDGTLGVDFDQAGPIALMAIRALDARITALEKTKP